MRTHGKAGKTPGKTYLGTFVIDYDPTLGPDPRIGFYAPRSEGTETDEPTDQFGGAVADVICAVLATQPDGKVDSFRRLRALLRATSHGVADTAGRNALDDLIVTHKVIEVRVLDVGRRPISYRLRLSLRGSEREYQQRPSLSLPFIT